MNFEMIFVFAVLLLAVYLFVTEKLPVDLVALVVMALLLVSGVVTPVEGLAGFSNMATITIAAMFILSAGLFRTGAVTFIGVFINRIFKNSFWIAILLVMIIVGVLSAFINNTPVIAIFLPILLGAARETGISASKILMPVSFASMFGGVCTLIGTSTNILVSSIAEKNNLPAFTMFEFAPLGLIMFAVGTAYLLLVGIRLIPERRGQGDLTESFALSEYLTEIVLLPHAASVGSKIRNSALVHDLDINIIEIRRGDERIQQPTGDVVLLADDILIVRCNLDEIRALQERSGIRFKPQTKWGDESITSEDFRLVEAVIDPNGPLVGSTLQRSNFRENYGGTVLAIRHNGKLLREKLSDKVLTAGDMLLVEIHIDRLNAFKRSNDLIVTSEQQTVEFRRNKVVIAVAVVAGVILAASLNFAPIVVTATVGAIILILTRCITLDEAYHAIEWKIIFLLAGVLSLGVALENTGAARLISTQLIGTVGTLGLIALVSAFYILTSLLTEMMSNTATAALLAPIAIATAATLGVNPQPFLVAVTFAASASFMTPVGYQTNTMIYGPGQYKFIDFLKVGTPLNIIFWLLATFLIPVFWKF
ncbi:MAG TPA: SLC13 family permease [Pyrinomonadaceae bacterium]|nr:SLC13 family permease [Acidobacteriota bacterium]HQZ97756.1 SLC13 family permease [Pyrinomonadaceae bacterium]